MKNQSNPFLPKVCGSACTCAKAFLVCIFLLFQLIASAQQITVTGVVTGEDKETIPGVTVLVKGTTIGAITDLNGKFSVTIPGKEAVLAFSFIGYTTQEIKVQKGSVLNVKLAAETKAISEVVIVGYGTQKKESVVGAISQINNAVLVQSAAPNVTSALSGKLSGVLTIQQTGEPGANQSEIVVRGLSSWNGSAPLILVDGVERDFSNMDPNEIATISVLKDASATAVFGAKGANGVIIITTNRGSLGKPKFTFSTFFGIQKPTSTPGYVDSYTTMSMLNVVRMNSQQFQMLTPANILQEYKNPSTPLNAIRYPSVNWYKEISQPFATSTNFNLSATGGTEFVKYFATLGYQNEGSFFKNNDPGLNGLDSRFWFKRFNFRTNLDFTLTKTTQLAINVGGDVGIRNYPSLTVSTDNGPDQEFWRSMTGAPVTEFPANYPAWVLDQIPDTDYPNATGQRRAASNHSWFNNPYNLVNSGVMSRSTSPTLFTDITIDQKLNFIKGLSVKGKVAYNSYYMNQSLTAAYYPPQYKINWSKVGVDANGDGKVDQNPWERLNQGLEDYQVRPLSVDVGGLNTYNTDFLFEAALNYNNTFGKHAVSALALMNRQKKINGSQFPFYNAAYVGRATYSYSDKYLVEFNLGYTGSERFAPGNRYGIFPSAALGWVISEEKFFKNAIHWMNKLKVRYSDGVVGSDLASSRWLYQSDFNVDGRGYLNEGKLPNETAQWEVARKKDLGVEIGAFKNQFKFSIDLYDEHRDKMLLTPQNVTYLVGNDFKDLNLGSLKKHGWEVEVEFNKTLPNKLYYYLKGIVSFTENRILFKDDPIYAPDYAKQAGKSLGTTFGESTTGTGYFTSVDNIYNYPSPVSAQGMYIGDYKFLDYNSDGKIDQTDLHPLQGNIYAPIVYSFSGGIGYKNLEIKCLFQGNYDQYITLSRETENEFYRSSNRVQPTQLDYWRPDNQDATHSTLHISDAELGDPITAWGWNWLDHSWRNASYIRLKELYVGYNLNLKRIGGISNILIYVSGNDLLTFTKLAKDYDPEVKSYGKGWYPHLSRYNFGLKVSF